MTQALGFSLLHFVWQGAACAALLASFNLLARRTGPQVRYLAAFATLLVMLGLPLLTFQLLRSDSPAKAGEGAGGGGLASLAGGPMGEPIVGAGHFDVERRIAPLLPGLVALWGSGVLLLSLRALGGLAVVQRLRRRGLAAPPLATLHQLARLVEALRVSAPVRLYESALVRVPTAIGWLRPVILLPASAVTGLSPDQLELIVAHELAHIRRHDYLANLFQTAAETLLFYHPAVWWASHRMRIEREHCCDDLAVAACGSAVRYARALADLEGACSRPPAMVMAATRGSLLARIARLIGPPPHLSGASRGMAALLALGSLALASGIGSLLIAAPVPRAPAASALALSGAPPEAEPEAAPPAPAPAPRPSTAPPKARAQPQPEPRAFPLDRVLELARAGVTPEFIDEMDALGYRSLTVDQLITLRTQGVSPDYIRAWAAEKYKNLTPEHLVSLRSQGVSAEFVRELREQGLVDVSLSDLVALRAQGVAPDFVAEMKQAGYTELSVSS
jgi:Zn-dependent protease with chaperone function